MLFAHSGNVLTYFMIVTVTKATFVKVSKNRCIQINCAYDFRILISNVGFIFHFKKRCVLLIIAKTNLRVLSGS